MSADRGEVAAEQSLLEGKGGGVCLGAFVSSRAGLGCCCLVGAVKREVEKVAEA